jgi:hypothetical protein
MSSGFNRPSGMAFPNRHGWCRSSPVADRTLVDVLNAFNRATEEGLATDNLYSPAFGQPGVFVDPRRVMFGARLDLGG